MPPTNPTGTDQISKQPPLVAATTLHALRTVGERDAVSLKKWASQFCEALFYLMRQVPTICVVPCHVLHGVPPAGGGMDTDLTTGGLSLSYPCHR